MQKRLGSSGVRVVIERRPACACGRRDGIEGGICCYCGGAIPTREDT